MDSDLSLQEKQIYDAIEQASKRVVQLETALKKEYGRGPELRLEPRNHPGPDSPYMRIQQLNRDIETTRFSAIKNTFEQAEALPKDQRQSAINFAFEKLMPEHNLRKVQTRQKENLTEHFKETENSQKPKTPNTQIQSKFINPEYQKADQPGIPEPVKVRPNNERNHETQQSKKQLSQIEGDIPVKASDSRFVSKEQPQPVQSLFVDLKRIQEQKQKNIDKNREKDDKEAEREK